MKKMYFKELMDLIVIVELNIAFLNMLNPVETCILKVRMNVFVYLTAPYISSNDTRNV